MDSASMKRGIYSFLLQHPFCNVGRLGVMSRCLSAAVYSRFADAS